MSEREMQHLSRTELLEILLAREQENIRLQAQVESLQGKLADRTLCIEKAGSIAQASLVLNGIFEAAQASCNQYIENIQLRSAQQDALAQKREQDAKAQADLLLRRTQEKCLAMEQETSQRCRRMEAEADKLVEEKWAQISVRLKDLYASYQGLRELVGLSMTLAKRGEDSASNATAASDH